MNEGLRLEALSLKLMDLVVLERQDFALEEMRSDEMLQNVQDGLAPLLAEKRISLRLDAEPVFILVDFDLFKTLVLNLIDNSMKAESANIHMTGERRSGSYFIQVRDDGRGIPSSELGKITEAFYRADKSRSRRQHGAGLGLTLAEKIVEIHHGTLQFESEEGVGTVVTLRLPCKGGPDEA